jgi:legumain
MYDNKMFNKLTFYLESCESGSMFEGMNIPGVYALSAANPTESSWGSYCGSAATVNGVSINSCLGDLFSVNWMEDAEAVDTTEESLDAAFNVIRAKTDRSEVMQWSDTTFTGDKVGEFIGNFDRLTVSKDAAEDPSKSAVSARQVDLDRLYHMYTAATTSAERLRIGAELHQELKQQMAVDFIHNKFLSIVFPGDEATQEAMRTRKAKPMYRECEMRVHNALERYASTHFVVNSGFALQFHQIMVNVCEEMSMRNGPIADLEQAIITACGSEVVV